MGSLLIRVRVLASLYSDGTSRTSGLIGLTICLPHKMEKSRLASFARTQQTNCRLFFVVFIPSLPWVETQHEAVI